MQGVVFDDTILRRAQASAEAARAKLTPVTLDVTKALICALLMAGAACGEVMSATMAIEAAYPRLSDGTSTADAIMGLRYILAFYALLGHVVISGVAGRLGSGTKWLLGLLGVLAVFTMVLGMGLFSFAGTFLTVGGDDDPSGWFGSLGALTGPALGVVGASLFAVSFVAACHLAGKLRGKLGVISAALAEQTKVAELDREISTADACMARIKAERRRIAEREKPGALCENVAVEMGRITGHVIAQAHEAVVTRRCHEGVELNDEDDAPFRDVPLAELEHVLADLQHYTIHYFRNLLKKED